MSKSAGLAILDPRQGAAADPESHVWLGASAVSYTHLDVYKRQRRMNGMRSARRGPMRMTTGARSKRIRNII